MSITKIRKALKDVEKEGGLKLKNREVFLIDILKAIDAIDKRLNKLEKNK